MNKKGFTIIEIIIITSVIVILAGITIVSVNPLKRIEDSRDAQRYADIQSIAHALELYTTDNGDIPSDFNITTVDIDEKYMLCGGANSYERTCLGETRLCVRVNDADFLGVYLDDLPIDPTKTLTSVSGYYITRKNDDMIAFGSCESDNDIEIVARSSFPEFAAVCGDGVLQGDEVCDSYQQEECTIPFGYYSDGYVASRSCFAFATCNSTCTSCGSECAETVEDPPKK